MLLFSFEMRHFSSLFLQITSSLVHSRCYSAVTMVSNKISVETFFVQDDERFFPNNDRLPVIVYRQVFDTNSLSASAWERLFKQNHFGKSWRDGIFTYHHYHSTAHEVLGCYAGRAHVRLGGDSEQVRKDIELTAGDCILIPTGVAHKNTGQDAQFAVVGAYDLDGKSYDMNYGKDADERRQAEENMRQVRSSQQSVSLQRVVISSHGWIGQSPTSRSSDGWKWWFNAVLEERVNRSGMTLFSSVLLIQGDTCGHFYFLIYVCVLLFSRVDMYNN